MNSYKKWDQLILKYIVIIGIIVLILLNFSNIYQFFAMMLRILNPIIIGFIMAYIVNILMKKIETWYFPNSSSDFINRSRRPVSMLLAYMIIIIIVFLVLSLILPQLYSVIIELIDLVPLLLASAKDWLTHNDNIIPQVRSYIEYADVQMEQIAKNGLDFVNNFTSNFIETTLSTVGSAVSFVVNSLLSLMISIYVLASKETLGHQAHRVLNAYFPAKFVSKFNYVVGIIDNSFRHFITGEVIEAFILGTMVTIGMWLFQFPYAGMIGALTGFTALIPYIGAYISGILGFLLIVVQSPIQGVLFLVFISVLQQFEGNLIYPKVVGESIGLPGLWVLVSITIGGGLWGIVGMLVAVPLASTVYQLVKNNVGEIENRQLKMVTSTEMENSID